MDFPFILDPNAEVPMTMLRHLVKEADDLIKEGDLGQARQDIVMISQIADRQSRNPSPAAQRVATFAKREITRLQISMSKRARDMGLLF